MDFDVRRLATDAGTFLSRAVQYTEEVLGQAEKTDLDGHLENLLAKAEATQQWTEKIMKQTEVLLQPNPNARLEEYLYDKLEKRPPARPNNLELLGECMVDSGHEFGHGTAYGRALIKCGEVEKQLGSAEREYSQSSTISFIIPLRNFIEGDCKTIVSERKLLQNKRLDLDAAKTRLRKAKEADTRSTMWAEEVAQAEAELMKSQSEFDRQAEITRLLLEGLSSTHTHHLRCLTDFVDCQTAYYEQCHQYMTNLQKQLGRFPSAFCANNNQLSLDAASDGICLPSTSTDPEPAALPVTAAALPVAPASLPVTPTPLPLQATGDSSPPIRELPISNGSFKARVLHDYNAASSSELSLRTDEVIIVRNMPDMDSDWLMGEQGDRKGKVPISCLHLQS